MKVDINCEIPKSVGHARCKLHAIRQWLLYLMPSNKGGKLGSQMTTLVCGLYSVFVCLPACLYFEANFLLFVS